MSKRVLILAGSPRKNGNSAALCRAFAPVSYTHLDVYKRQSIHCIRELVRGGLGK